MTTFKFMEIPQMFRKTRTKLSLMFNRQAITTHQFRKHTRVNVGHEFTGHYMYSIPGLSAIWAEAVPVSKGRYAVTQKRHETHHGFAVSGKSKFYVSGVNATFDGKKKTIFTRDEAIAVLKDREREFEKSGYTVNEKQSFKKRIYTNKENIIKTKLA